MSDQLSTTSLPYNIGCRIGSLLSGPSGPILLLQPLSSSSSGSSSPRFPTHAFPIVASPFTTLHYAFSHRRSHRVAGGASRDKARPPSSWEGSAWLNQGSSHPCACSHCVSKRYEVPRCLGKRPRPDVKQAKAHFHIQATTVAL